MTTKRFSFEALRNQLMKGLEVEDVSVTPQDARCVVSRHDIAGRDPRN
jgi:hypothetical protein